MRFVKSPIVYHRDIVRDAIENVLEIEDEVKDLGLQQDPAQAAGVLVHGFSRPQSHRARDPKVRGGLEEGNI